MGLFINIKIFEIFKDNIVFIGNFKSGIDFCFFVVVLLWYKNINKVFIVFNFLIVEYICCLGCNFFCKVFVLFKF